ncbi:hypothetical protein IAU60_002048 [Kwoniella sp. DSM 27419]
MVRGSDIILILVAIIFPPLAAGMISGCGCDLLINILLTCLGYLPGHLHAFWLIYKKIKAEETYGPGGYTYMGNGNFVGNGPAVGHHPHAGNPPPPGQQYYGSTQ